MLEFPLRAELHNCIGTNEQLISSVAGLFPFDFHLTCKSPSNNFQLSSDFDSSLHNRAKSIGWHWSELDYSEETPVKHDGVFNVNDAKVVLEIEKANRHKFLYDLLKCHVYVDAGASGCLIVLPINWPYARGTQNLYRECLLHLKTARKHEAIRADVDDALVIVGFRQMYNEKLLDPETREEIREQCRSAFGSQK